MGGMRWTTFAALGLAACSSSSGGSAPVTGASDSGSDGAAAIPEAGALDAGVAKDGGDAASEVGDAGSGSASLSGTFGTQPVAPVVAAYWVGKPSNPAESGGGPYIYMFSTAVSCAELSQGTGWSTRIASGTQVLELIVGTTMIGVPVSATAHAAPGAAEINYLFGGTTNESRATSGMVTLTAYAAGASVDGTVDATFPMGSVTGSFHAVYCATGNEL